MLAFPQHGFVLLALPKSGTSALHHALARHAQVTAAGPPPSLKHLTASDFDTYVAPLLAAHGHPRESYEVVAMVREPVSWLVSWWRYRSRERIRDKPAWTGDLEFADFVDRVADGRVHLAPQSHWVQGPDGGLAADRLFRYEDFDAAVAWMAGRLGRPVEVEKRHASPGREPRLDDDLRARVEAHYAADVALHRSLG